MQETVSTCKFAQRVSLMSTEAQINEEIDPQQEIMILRDEVQELRRQLVMLKGLDVITPKKSNDKCKYSFFC